MDGPSAPGKPASQAGEAGGSEFPTFLAQIEDFPRAAGFIGPLGGFWQNQRNYPEGASGIG
jgi:hypothetical protein